MMVKQKREVREKNKRSLADKLKGEREHIKKQKMKK